MVWPFDIFRRNEPALDPHEAQDVVVLMDASLDARLVVYHDPGSFPAEQYRAFRTNLRAMNPGDAPRTLMFTSAQPDEGKSTSVANIALSLAEFQDLRVCLIDLDLRAPRQDVLFGLPSKPGITDVLLDRVDPSRALRPAAPNLSVIPAGRPTAKPSEVVSSAYLPDLIGHLKREFQYILIDTPPCGLFADASQLCKSVDGTIMVVALRNTMKRDADDAVEVLRSAGANVMGSFVTGTSTSATTIVAEYGEV